MFEYGEVRFPHTSLKHIRDSLKVNLFYIMTFDKVYGPIIV